MERATWDAMASANPNNVKRVVTNAQTLTQSLGVTALPGTVPGHEFWHPLAIRITVVTDATVRNRALGLVYQFTGLNLFTVPQPLAQTASQTAAYTFMLGVGFTTNAGTSPNISAVAPLPDFILEPGNSLAFQIVGSAGADTVNSFEFVNEVMWTGDDDAPATRVAFDRLGEVEHQIESAKF